MRNDTTNTLTQILMGVKTEKDAEDYINEHTNVHYGSFSEYFKTYITKENLVMADIIKNSSINKNYVYQIIDGSKQASRDKLLALCIGAGMNYTSTNRALKAGGKNPIDPKNPRDVRIAICINQGLKKVLDVNICLEENGLDLFDWINE